jgi:hypothetical protein
VFMCRGERECVCVREREDVCVFLSLSVCACVCEREGERLCVCVHVCERAVSTYMYRCIDVCDVCYILKYVQCKAVQSMSLYSAHTVYVHSKYSTHTTARMYLPL